MQRRSKLRKIVIRGDELSTMLPDLGTKTTEDETRQGLVLKAATHESLLTLLFMKADI